MPTGQPAASIRPRATASVNRAVVWMKGVAFARQRSGLSADVVGARGGTVRSSRARSRRRIVSLHGAASQAQRDGGQIARLTGTKICWPSRAPATPLAWAWRRSSFAHLLDAARRLPLSASSTSPGSTPASCAGPLAPAPPAGRGRALRCERRGCQRPHHQAQRAAFAFGRGLVGLRAQRLPSAPSVRCASGRHRPRFMRCPGWARPTRRSVARHLHRLAIDGSDHVARLQVGLGGGVSVATLATSAPSGEGGEGREPAAQVLHRHAQPRMLEPIGVRDDLPFSRSATSSGMAKARPWKPPALRGQICALMPTTRPVASNSGRRSCRGSPRRRSG